MRDLELPRFGLQVIPYEGGAIFTARRRLPRQLWRSRRDAPRDSRGSQPRDAENYDRYARGDAPVPVHPAAADAHAARSRGPRAARRRRAPVPRPPLPRPGPARDGRHHPLLDHVDRRLPRRVFRDAGDQGASRRLRHHRHGLGPIRRAPPMCCCTTTWATSTASIGAWGFARGGMGAITQALAARFEAAGGEIRTGCRRRAHPGPERPGHRRGAGERRRDPGPRRRLQPGREAHLPEATSSRSILPDDFLKGVRQFKIRGSSGKLNIALDAMPEFPALPKGAPFLKGDLHFSEFAGEPGARLRRLEGRALVGRSLFRHADPDQIDPTMAPPGKHFMTVFVQYARRADDGRDWTEPTATPSARPCSTRSAAPARTSATSSSTWRCARRATSRTRSG